MSEQAEITEPEFGEQDPWSNKRLGDIFENIYSGGTPKKGVDKFYNGDIPFVKIEDLNAQKLGGVTTAEEHITEKAIEETSVRAFEKGTLLFTIYGSLAETALVRSEVATNQAILGLWGAEKDNVLYVKYAIDNHQSRLESLSRQTTQANLGKGIVEKYQIPTPPLEEQRKIASVLYTVDQAIQQTEEIIGTTKRLKRGTLQNTIFDVDEPDSADRRFGPMVFKIREHWDRVRLQDVTALVTRGKQPTYADDGIPVINQECIYWDDFHFENIRYLNEDIGNDWKRKYFPTKGDVLINSTGQGTLGRAQVYQDDKKRAVDSHVTIVRPDTERMIPGYFRYLLESNRGQGLLYSMCVTGSTGQIELSKSKLQLLSIPLPPIDEQQEIVDTVGRFDQNIRKQQEYQNRLQRLKQGLMQDLLSGEVRTHDKDIEIVDEVLAHG